MCGGALRRLYQRDVIETRGVQLQENPPPVNGGDNAVYYRVQSDRVSRLTKSWMAQGVRWRFETRSPMTRQPRAGC
jgi:hypothetical protein